MPEIGTVCESFALLDKHACMELLWMELRVWSFELLHDLM